ncbi:MAG: protein O-mannosyl-transferase [Chthoniobacter sp.]|jgi:tetratricopeptide (TPR) repeat protein|nr:protein O-mannosyl-transferase [Chthoniobacter sp.]
MRTAPARIIARLKNRAAVILLLLAAAFAVYAPALRNGFVWDDTALVLRDPFIRSWRLIPEGFRHFLFTDATASDFYRPLQRLTYTWDYASFGFAPWGYHLSNILLHGAAAVMLFLFLEKWLASVSKAAADNPGPVEASLANETRPGRRFPLLIAAAASLIWTIHPLHSSAVTYIAGRADLLMALCGFAGLYLALCKSKRAAFASVVCFLAAMLSKESGLVVLGIGLVFLFRHRHPRWLWSACCAGALAIYAALRLSAEHQSPPLSSEKITLAAAPIVAVRALAEYAGLLVAPVRLHMERSVLPFGRGNFPETVRAARWREYQTLLGAALLIALIAWLRWAKRHEPAAFASLGCFLAAYLPISNLIPLNATVAEHWLYFPSAFLFIAAALSFTHLRLSREAGATLLLIWAAFLATRTFTRNFDWHDQRTFFERTIADGGGSPRMLMNLGGLESAQGNQRVAIGYYKSALERAPGQPFALRGLAAAYLRSGNFPEAREQLEQAVRDPFVRAEAIQDLAVLEYKESGKDRVDLLRQAAELAPGNWSIQKRYIGHLDERGDHKEAIVALKNVVEAQPWRGESWRMLGDLWSGAGMSDSARRAYSRAAALDVHDDDSRQKLNSLGS